MDPSCCSRFVTGAALLLLRLVSLSLQSADDINLTPVGHAVLPLNSELSINCSLQSENLLLQWVALCNNNSIVFHTRGDEPPGIRISQIERSSSVILYNATVYNEIIAVECKGFITSSSTFVTRTLNLTIFGIPDPPGSLVELRNDMLLTHWVSPTNVDLTYNLTLTFHLPSMLDNSTASQLSTNSHDFDLEGQRSCDCFRVCIGAKTERVQGEQDSCAEGCLPLVATPDMINFTLVQNDSVELMVLVTIPDDCLVLKYSMEYMLVVVNMETGDILVSDRVPALSTTTLLKMDDLKAEQNLKLEIISFNSLGNATSASVNFDTYDRVSICSCDEEEYYHISCSSRSDVKSEGCEVSLTNSSTNETKKIVIEGNSMVMRILHIEAYDYLKVIEGSGNTIRVKEFDSESDVSECPDPTQHTHATDLVEKGGSGFLLQYISIGVATFIILLIMPFILFIYLCKRGKNKGIISNSKEIKDCKEDISKKSFLNHGDPVGYNKINRVRRPDNLNLDLDLEQNPEAKYALLHQEPMYYTLIKDSSTSTEEGATPGVSAYAISPVPKLSSHPSQHCNTELSNHYYNDNVIYDNIVNK